jgi:IS30 family transposase
MKKVHLTREQRYTISVMNKQKCSQKLIAEYIGKDKLVVCRELKRNADDRDKYSFAVAWEPADLRKEGMKITRKLKSPMKNKIVTMLEQDLSPEQITGRLKLENQPYVCHESIYKIIRIDKTEGETLYKHTRHRLKHRKRPVGKFIPVKNRVSIDMRLEIVNTKERFGDWEIDTIVGNDNHGAILTITKRQTNFPLPEKLEHGKNAPELAKTAVSALFAFRDSVHTVTGDNGTEFAEHENIAKKLKTKLFFTHPYSSWEKGSIENANKLIRQYIPKGTNFETLNNQQIKQIQYKINNRPGKKLNFYSPKEIFHLNLQNSKVAFRC